jgi:hypothetical protein
MWSFDDETRAKIAKKLPPGANVKRALAAMTKLANELVMTKRRLPNVEVHEMVAFCASAMNDPAFVRHKELLRRTVHNLVQVRELIVQAMQGEKQQQEALYEKLLRIWVAQDGDLTAGDPKTGSPCVRYLITVIEAITGEKMSISGARKVVRRLRTPLSRKP